MPYSWFYFDLVKNVSKDKTLHACQIPLPLVKMLIKASTQKNDDCFILFGGSGSEIVLCQNLQRNFLSCENTPQILQNDFRQTTKRGKNQKGIQTRFYQTKRKTISNSYTF